MDEEVKKLLDTIYVLTREYPLHNSVIAIREQIDAFRQNQNKCRVCGEPTISKKRICGMCALQEMFPEDDFTDWDA